MGGASIVVVLLMAFGPLGTDPNTPDPVAATALAEAAEIKRTVDQHLITESPHTGINLQLKQIFDELEDIEDELKDKEKTDEKINKSLIDLKLILCSNENFNCNLMLES